MVREGYALLPYPLLEILTAATQADVHVYALPDVCKNICGWGWACWCWIHYQSMRLNPHVNPLRSLCRDHWIICCPPPPLLLFHSDLHRALNPTMLLSPPALLSVSLIPLWPPTELMFKRLTGLQHWVRKRCSRTFAVGLLVWGGTECFASFPLCFQWSWPVVLMKGEGSVPGDQQHSDQCLMACTAERDSNNGRWWERAKWQSCLRKHPHWQV